MTKQKWIEKRERWEQNYFPREMNLRASQRIRFKHRDEEARKKAGRETPTLSRLPLDSVRKKYTDTLSTNFGDTHG